MDKTQMDRPKVIAAIPCYNEEQFIDGVVRKVNQYIDQVVVVDDGSSDRTTEVAEAAGAMVVRHYVNRGPGGAYKTCFEVAREKEAEILITLMVMTNTIPTSSLRLAVATMF